MNFKKKRLQVRMKFAVYLFGLFVSCMGLAIINPHGCVAAQAEEAADTENAYEDSQGLIFTLSGDGLDMAAPGTEESGEADRISFCTLSAHTETIPAKVVIPAEITVSGSSYKVRGIESRALADCSGLYEVDISNEIKEIAPDAFLNCKDLGKIRIIPSKWKAENFKNTAYISIKLNSGSLPENVNKEVVITEDVVKKALIYKKAEKVRITLKLNEPQSFPKVTYGKKAAKRLRHTKKNLTLRFISKKGGFRLINLEPADIKKANGNPTLLFNEITEEKKYGRADKDVKKAVKKSGISKKDIRVLQYISKIGNKSPARLWISTKKDKTYYIYRYINKEGKFCPVSLKPSLKASNGKLGFYAQKNGIYIITQKPLKSMVGKLTDEFVKEGFKTYYVDKKGNITKGWIKKGKNYYYLDRKSGEMASSKKVDGIRLRADGTAVTTEYAVAKIDVMMKARKIVDSVTLPTDTKEEKMKKCFLWVFQYPYRRFRTLESVSNQKGWEIIFANDIFDRKMGCCISESAAVAFLFKECGCDEVYIGSDTSHGWVEYNGRVYDPLFAEARGIIGYYNVSYESAKLWLIIKKRV